MNKTIYILLFVAAVLGGGCSDWLDVKVKGQSEEEEMFDSEAGFYQTLTGTYTLLLKHDAYGNEVTAGFTEEIVRNWEERSEFHNFKYDDTQVVARLDSTWYAMYKAIANANLLIKHLDSKDRPHLEHYDLIRGEALGLRAYIHLDLLRLFGPVIGQPGGMDKMAIPYHEDFSNRTVPIMTAREVLAKIETDLKEAYDLLDNDPIKQYGRKHKATDDDPGPDMPDLAFNYRGIRMNYYAVCGTLARYYMLTGNKTAALQYANEVIEATGIFEFVSTGDLTDDTDQMFQRELVFALYDQKIKERLSDYFPYRYTTDKDYKIYVYTAPHAYGSGGDIRSNLLWTETVTTPTMYALSKYIRRFSSTNSDNTPWDPVIPMIRLTEMYYIAAEAVVETDTEEAYRLINLVRKSRGMESLPSELAKDAPNMMKQITYEVQKDTWGEGKLFYHYKRLFLDIATRTVTVPASNQIYELPTPKDEIEHGGN